ncbi:MAG: methyltransferase domain-containing protein [Acidimicrobiia bacterium]|nr:methyltransferase domain-containing protein [Acidimicrobiia bacterium]
MASPPATNDELERWERRYRTEGRRVTEPSAFVIEAMGALAVKPGEALDVAGGTGRHALWLAGRGWTVTLVDGSATALAMASADAAAAGVDIITAQLDLATEPLPPGPWHLVLIHHYLHRALLAGMDTVLAPAGHLIFAQPTVVDPHPRPGPAHRVAIGETATLVPGLEIVSLVEGETEGRHEAMLVARKPV